MSALFDDGFWKIFSKSVKSGATKIIHIFKTIISRKPVFVVNYRYRVALAISLKGSSIFLDREFRHKNGLTSEFGGKSEKSGDFVNTVIFLFSMCVKHKNTLCVKISKKNIDF